MPITQSLSGSNNAATFVADPSSLEIVNLKAKQPISARMSNHPSGTTGETTEEMMHPSVLRFERPWNGYQWWMACTPYPGAIKVDAPIWENPTLLVSHDGYNWVEAPSVTNPVYPCPSSSLTQGDVSLSYNEDTNQLQMVWLRTFSGGYETRFGTSSNGSTWSTAQVISNTGSTKGSPNLVSFVNASGQRRWRLYYNRPRNDGSYGLNMQEASSPTGVGGSWNSVSETICVTNGLGLDRNHWDFQMYRLSSGQWLACSSTTIGTEGGATRTVLGVSEDGINFSFGIPTLRRQRAGVFPDTLVYTTALVPYTNGGFRAYVSGLQANVGWGMTIADLLPRDTAPLANATKVFEFDHRFNITPASGTLSTVSASTVEGVAAASTIVGGTRNASEIQFTSLTHYVNWLGKAFAKPEKWTAVCTFRPLGNPATASGQQTIFFVGNINVLLTLSNQKWMIKVAQSGDAAMFFPQIIDPYTNLITIVVSWDGTVARYGSSLLSDYGGPQEAVITSVVNNGDIWLGSGNNTGSPGGIAISRFVLFDKAVTRNLEGLARSI
jgi:hypothetical protein